MSAPVEATEIVACRLRATTVRAARGCYIATSFTPATALRPGSRKPRRSSGGRAKARGRLEGSSHG